MDKILARGKINLTLEVVGELDDGYHAIRSVMQGITLCDELIVKKSANTEIICADKTVPTDERNTVYRAIEIFFDEISSNERISVEIIKGIPHEAGLGAASADAAAILRYLWEKYGEPFSKERLMSIATKIGADVPFCVFGGTALAEGKGEKLTKLPSLPPCQIVIVKPPFGASTPEIFKKYDALPAPQNPNSEYMIEAITKQDIRAVGKHLGNVLEECVDIHAIKELILEYKPYGAAMSGSGTAVFGLFAENIDLSELVNRAKSLGNAALICTPVMPY